MTAMLDIRGLSHRYGNDTVLDAIDLSVEQGDTLVLFGPSGAGKTVLLRVIAGSVLPDTGTVSIAGEDMHGVLSERRDIGMAFQNFALFPHMSAFDNIASPLAARGQSKSAIRDAVEQVATLLKIEHVLAQRPAALSNGQKQRTSLARALVGAPRLLLLDDPLRNVDAKLRFEMRLELPRLLREQGTTVIYVTQDYKEAMALGDRIGVLVDGRLVQVATPEDIYRQPATRQIAALFGDPAINLLEVTPEADAEGTFIRLSDVRIGLPTGSEASVGKRCLFGIRPEHIDFVEAGSAESFPVTVEAETPLNEKIVDLVLTEGGREILVSRPSFATAPDSENLALRVHPDDALLFDAETGERLAIAELDGDRAVA